MEQKEQMVRFNPNAIRTLRKLEDLSQTKLAKRLEVTPDTIRNYEQGKSAPSGYVVDRIWRDYILTKGYDLELFIRS